MMLNLKSKYWFYEKTNDFIVFIFRKDKEAKNWVQKPKSLRYEHQILEELNNIMGTSNKYSTNEILLIKEEQES